MSSPSFRTISAVAFFSLLLAPTSFAVVQDPVAEIVVSEGTPINVITAQEITSKAAKPNDPVNFTVNEDLVINGQVVVRKGTAAIGSVINAEKGGYLGKSGKLGVQVESTQTIDGQPLKLRAAKGKEGKDKTNSTMALSMIVPFFLLKKGGDASIAAGTAVTVYTAEEKRFRVDGSTLVAVVPETGAAVNAADAIVYIYRPSKMVGKALEPSVFVDDKELARMDNGRYFALKLKPGKHIIHMTDDKKGYAIDMGPGQTYYFRIGVEMGMWKGRGKITLDDADRAIGEIKKIKFIGQDKIKAADMVVDIPLQ
ncbi:MAG TPA: DUF2846 domain-containing protein [Pyrinomonadaceae bacterium]|nr:DUF2846 domain-containing protein [Pyrinomonadaceae bacterium]